MRRRTRRLTRRARRRMADKSGSLESELKAALGRRNSATIRGIYVTRVRPGHGLHIIVPSRSRGGGDPEYAEVWNADGCYTWVVPYGRKADLRDVRLGRRQRLRRTSRTRRASPSRDVVDYTPSMRNRGALRDAVRLGLGMPFIDGDLRRVTRNLVVDGLTLVVPDGRPSRRSPTIDFLPQSSRGMVVGMWGQGVQSRVLRERGRPEYAEV